MLPQVAWGPKLPIRRGEHFKFPIPEKDSRFCRQVSRLQPHSLVMSTDRKNFRRIFIECFSRENHQRTSEVFGNTTDHNDNNNTGNAGSNAGRQQNRYGRKFKFCQVIVNFHCVDSFVDNNLVQNNTLILGFELSFLRKQIIFLSNLKYDNHLNAGHHIPGGC